MPRAKVVPQKVTDGALVARFDGGVKNKLGTGGYVVFSPGGECLWGRACWFGEVAPTSNQAEARAMVECLRSLCKQQWPPGISDVVLAGDSKLVISFLTR